MERIKALYTPNVGKCKEATIIEFGLRVGHEFSEDFYEAIWLDNGGHIYHNPISDLTVDMDSLSSSKKEEALKKLFEMLDKTLSELSKAPQFPVIGDLEKPPGEISDV